MHANNAVYSDSLQDLYVPGFYVKAWLLLTITWPKLDPKLADGKLAYVYWPALNKFESSPDTFSKEV